MIHYLLHREDGSVFQRGHCPTEQDIPQVDGMSYEVIDVADTRKPSSAPDPTYADYRRMAYPSIGDQLDAIWKAMAGGDASEMLARVQAVKDQFPKS